MKICPICDFQYNDDVERCPRHEVELTSVGEEKQDPLIGTVLRNKYKVNKLIGRGSMGTVYRCTQINDVTNDVAIKVLHTHLTNNSESLKRFHHEAKAAQRLRHPHIVAVHDIGLIDGGQPYIAMEYLEGQTLSDFLRKERSLPMKRALPIMRQICEALADAHSHGVIHRDIKPANIMLVNRFGEEHFVVVVDFSIAKVIQRVSDVDSTTPGLIFGSPAYMSPERFMGKGGDFRSDIYSTGIIMFQMLAGVPPFRAGDLYTLMHEHVKMPTPKIKSINPKSDVTEELELTIARALFKRPEDRQENMRQLLNEVNKALDRIYNTSMNISSSDVSSYTHPSEEVAPEAEVYEYEEPDNGQKATAHREDGTPEILPRPPVQPQVSNGPNSLEEAVPQLEPIQRQRSGRSGPALGGTPVRSGPGSKPGIGPGSGSPKSGPSIDPMQDYPTPLYALPTVGGTPSYQLPVVQPGAQDQHTPYALPTVQPGAQDQRAQPYVQPADPSGRMSPASNPVVPSGRNTSGRDSSVHNPALQAQAPYSVSSEQDRRRSSSSRDRDSQKTRAINDNQGAPDLSLVPVVGLVAAIAIVIFLVMQLQTATMEERADKLITQGRLDDAGHVLMLWRAEGRLSKQDAAECDMLCLKLAKEYAKQKRYKAAVNYLNQVSEGSPVYPEVQMLKRMYGRYVKM